MSENQEINSEYIDIYTINQNKLVAYPFGLIFGTPIIEDFQLKFKPNSYIKILHFEFVDYLKLFQLLINFFCMNSSEKEEIQTLNDNKYLQNHIIVAHGFPLPSINQKDIYVTYCNLVTHPTINVTIGANLPQKVEFKFTQTDIYLLMQGFNYLFFQVYCYQENINIYIKQFIDTEKETTFEQLLLNQDIPSISELLIKYQIPKKVHFRLCQTIIRHAKELLHWNKVNAFFLSANHSSNN